MRPPFPLCHFLPFLGKSDHSVLQFSCQFLCSRVEYTPKFNYVKGDYDNLKLFVNNRFSSPHLVNEFGEVSLFWDNLKSIISEGCIEYIPVIQNNSNVINKWQKTVPVELRKLIKKKHRLWTRFQETRCKKIECEYKRIRNLVRKGSRKQIQSVQHDIAKNCKLNPKKFWKYVNSKKSTFGGLGDLKIVNDAGECVLITDDSEKANEFSNYFANIFSTESDEIFSNLGEINPVNSMPQIEFTVGNVQQKLDTLKVCKSPGPDSIHPKVLFEIRNIIAQPLTTLFQNSMRSGEIPPDWLSSIITVLHKKGSKSCVSNYRPISLTSIPCKIMESLIRDQIMIYFLSNNLFSNRQYGFIKGRSTSLQLLRVTDEWTSHLDKGGQIDVIYTDFEKAFDKVPHKRLLSKLHSYGVNEELISWIKSFLCKGRYTRTG